MQKIEIMSVSFSNMSKEDYKNTVSKRIDNGERTIIFTPNPQMLLGARKDSATREILQKADICIPDGVGIIIASKMLRSPIKETVCGIDFAEDILCVAQEKGLSVFLLGSKEGRAEKAQQALQARFPSLKICGTHHGYFSKSGEENNFVISKINGCAPDAIFVCFGFPDQERWIAQNVQAIPSCKLAMGLGGSIDVWSGHVKRAPKPFRQMRLEWLWRAAKEPHRLRIFCDIPVFLFAVLKEKQKALRKSEAP